MPCGIVFVGSTLTSLSFAIGPACSAAIIMFLLLGNTYTTFAGVFSIALKISSVDGFIVCPPLTIVSAPMSLKSSSSPLPAHTATNPYSFSGSHTSGSTGFSPSFTPTSAFACWYLILSILMLIS